MNFYFNIFFWDLIEHALRNLAQSTPNSTNTDIQLGDSLLGEQGIMLFKPIAETKKRNI